MQHDDVATPEGRGFRRVGVCVLLQAEIAEGVAAARANRRHMTPEHEASRTLVKSPPELWAELSDAASLARHLTDFGEIRITRLEPETAVAWEGERARGTVRLEPSGWGTRVVLTAQEARVDAGAETLATAEIPSTSPGPAQPTLVPDPEPSSPGPGRAPDPTPPVHDPAPPGEPAPSPLPPAARRPSGRRLLARLRGFLSPQGTAASAPVAPRMPPPAEARPPSAAPEESAGPTPPAAMPPALTPAAAAREATESDASAPAPADADTSATGAILTAALDSLGQAHHRPFSRA